MHKNSNKTFSIKCCCISRYSNKYWLWQGHSERKKEIFMTSEIFYDKAVYICSFGNHSWRRYSSTGRIQINMTTFSKRYLIWVHQKVVSLLSQPLLFHFHIETTDGTIKSVNVLVGQLFQKIYCCWFVNLLTVL